MLAILHPPKDDQNRLNKNTKYHHEIKTDAIEVTIGIKLDDIKKLKKTEQRKQKTSFNEMNTKV